MNYIVKFKELGIDLKHDRGSKKYKCPNCIATKKDKSATDLSITFHPDRVLYQCHNGCGFKGVVFLNPISRPSEKTYKRPEPAKIKDNKTKLYEYWQKRGISKETIDKFEVQIGERKIKVGDKWETIDQIIFPYYKDAELVNHKYRWSDPESKKKKFMQDKEAEQVFYGMDLVTDFSRIVITEGEPDVLSFAEVGIEAISISQGAEEDKLECIENCWEWLQQFDEYIICVDNDPPYTEEQIAKDPRLKTKMPAGDKLRKNLIRRLGADKCKIASYKLPCGDKILEEFKDANEALLKSSDGKGFLDAIINWLAVPVPIENILSFSDVDSSINELYERGIEDNCSTGWKSVDEIFTIKTGHLMVITGVPSRGKSLFTNNLLYNLSAKYEWRHLVASFEDTPETHFATLASMRTREPFFGFKKMSLESLQECKSFINEHFLRLDNGKSWNFDEILEKAESCVRQYGIKCLVIDPYSNLDIDTKENETTAIKQMLSKATSTARRLDILIIFVAHPAKTYNNKDGKETVPTLKDISGSIHWRNFCHYGIVIDRLKENEELGKTMNVIVEKVKSIFLGRKTTGRTKLEFKDYALIEVVESAPKGKPKSEQKSLFGN